MTKNSDVKLIFHCVQPTNKDNFNTTSQSSVKKINYTIIDCDVSHE